MTAWLIAGADAIQADVEARLSAAQSYKKLTLDEKLQEFLTAATDRLAEICGTPFSVLRPLITDFISVGASIYERHHTMDVSKKATMLGLAGIELHSVDLGGASLPAALEQARRLCQNPDRLVLIAGAEVPRGGPTGIAYYREVSDALLEKHTELHTHTNLISLYALFADRMMHEEKISIDDVEAITTYYRSLALNDERAAMYQKPLREGELKRYLAGCYATPMVAVATDHGAAFLVAGENMLERLRKSGFQVKTPLVIRAVGINSAAKYITQRRDFSSPGKWAARRAFLRSGMQANEIDYAWIYDCFTLMLVRQAADYFGLAPKEVANTLHSGYLQLADKRIAVNHRGGILNTQAAISLSAASGLLDILDYAEKNPQAQNFLYGGNGGLDTINAVALLSRHAGPFFDTVLAQESQVITCTLPQHGEMLHLYAAVIVRFNPGTEVPFALGAFRRQDGTLVLSRFVAADGSTPEDTVRFARDKALFRLEVNGETLIAHEVQ